jgi:hypothetical protein
LAPTEVSIKTKDEIQNFEFPFTPSFLLFAFHLEKNSDKIKT